MSLTKVYCFVLVAVWLTPPTLAAQKHDYNWITGYHSQNPQTGWWGVSQIDFNQTPPSISYIADTPVYMNWGGSTMSDENGQLIYYSNGCYIMNANHQIVEGGDGLNPGNVRDQWCGANRGYPIMQGSIHLPMPGQPGTYLMVHLSAKLVDNELVGFADRLYYSLIDMKANQGMGKVLDINHLLIEDTLCFGQLTAVKHGNGRDWWIIIPESSSNRYYKFLLTESGISVPEEQHIGKNWLFQDWNGQAVFSPDGSRYLRFDPYNQLNIFNFDRCTGLFSNPVFIDTGCNPDTTAAGGIAVSPNGRYVYVSTDFEVRQYDLEAPDIAASGTVVAVFDGFQYPPGFYTTFYAAQLTPDGKIFINCSFSTKYLHIIHAPNEAGSNCQIEQHGLELAGLNAFTMPYFPNYRLYDIQGSVCDTLGINGQSSIDSDKLFTKTDHSIFPNPADQQIVFDFHNVQLPVKIQILNATGCIIESLSGTNRTCQVSTAQLTDGIYIYQLQTTDGKLQLGKFIVAH